MAMKAWMLHKAAQKMCIRDRNDTMDYYFFIKLRRKVPTRKHKLGMDTAVCRAESKEAAVAQLLPEMRDCVEYVSQRWAMRDCYPNPKGILRDEVI